MNVILSLTQDLLYCNTEILKYYSIALNDEKIELKSSIISLHFADLSTIPI
jgi:hypothetical protein